MFLPFLPSADGENPAKLPSQTLSQTVSHPDFQLLPQMAYVRFHRRKRVHSALLKGSHTRAYTAKHGPSERGRYHYPRHVLHVHEHPRAGCQNGVLCRFGILAGRCSRRTQKAFGTAMRLCVSLSRGVAAPLGCVIFFSLLSKLWLVRPAFRAFRVYGAGVVSLPSACSACCRSSRHPLVKAANLPFSEVG